MRSRAVSSMASSESNRVGSRFRSSGRQTAVAGITRRGRFRPGGRVWLWLHRAKDVGASAYADPATLSPTSSECYYLDTCFRFPLPSAFLASRRSVCWGHRRLHVLLRRDGEEMIPTRDGCPSRFKTEPDRMRREMRFARDQAPAIARPPRCRVTGRHPAMRGGHGSCVALPRLLGGRRWASPLEILSTMW